VDEKGQRVHGMAITRKGEGSSTLGSPRKGGMGSTRTRRHTRRGSRRARASEAGGTRASSCRTTSSGTGSGRAWARRRSPDHGRVPRVTRGEKTGGSARRRGRNRLRPAERARLPNPTARPGVGTERPAVVSRQPRLGYTHRF
jgi:hypothetical protein